MAPNIDGGVTVKYIKDGVKTSKTLRFEGNLTLEINGVKYYSSGGHLYNMKTNEEILCFNYDNKDDNAKAYQLLGMSCTAESAKDYTFSIKDIDEARTDSNNEAIGEDGTTKSDRRSASVIGNGAGKVIITGKSYIDDKYTTKYKSHDTGKTSTISIWLTK